MKQISTLHRCRLFLISLGCLFLLNLFLIGCSETESPSQTLTPKAVQTETQEGTSETVNYTDWEVPGPEELAAFHRQAEQFREELNTEKRNIPRLWMKTEDPFYEPNTNGHNS